MYKYSNAIIVIYELRKVDERENVYVLRLLKIAGIESIPSTLHTFEDVCEYVLSAISRRNIKELIQKRINLLSDKEKHFIYELDFEFNHKNSVKRKYHNVEPGHASCGNCVKIKELKKIMRTIK